MGTVCVQLELDHGDGPIRGRIIYPHGTALAFSGWLELSTLLENARLEPQQTLGSIPSANRERRL